MSYLAPEQVRSEPIDRRADIYSAGVILWGLLTGRRLIRADNDGAIVAQILSPNRPSPRELNPAVPPALDAVCVAVIALDPAARPPTAADFGEAIEAAAARDGIVIAPSSAVAALVKDLETHEALGELPSSKTPTSSSITAQSGVVVRGELSAPGVIPIIGEVAKTASAPEASVPAPSVAPPSSTMVEAVVPTPPPAARRSLAWGAIAVGVVVAALAIVTLVRGFDGGSTPAAAASAASAPRATTLDPATPPVIAVPAIVSAIPAAIATASATSSARAQAGPAPARSSKPVVKGSTPATSPTNFAPSEL